MTWPQPHMCWVAGTRTLRPSRSPRSGFGPVSGNEGWWPPARTAALPRLWPHTFCFIWGWAWASRQRQEHSGGAWGEGRRPFFSKQYVFQNLPAMVSSQPGIHGCGCRWGSLSPAGLHTSFRPGCWFGCICFLLKVCFFFTPINKIPSSYPILHPFSPVGPLVVRHGVTLSC